MSVFMTAQITVLAYAGRYLDGGNEQPGGDGDSLDIFFLLTKILVSVWPPEYAAQYVSSVLSEPSERAPQQGPQEHCAAQVTSWVNGGTTS